ncbi:uncharacterized protein HaLaN_31602 [Haematococcus lacustris]|uniref:Uncharacterized protein n=1 Tax=Haematococcus lacustris TaxID=44745 RepID=A0A6A0AJD6_HAELA|nr:uncharacterized protein HaLaN_31602 [Haematococcus lacustris]
MPTSAQPSGVCASRSTTSKSSTLLYSSYSVLTGDIGSQRVSHSCESPLNRVFGQVIFEPYSNELAACTCSSQRACISAAYATEYGALEACSEYVHEDCQPMLGHPDFAYDCCLNVESKRVVLLKMNTSKSKQRTSRHLSASSLNNRPSSSGMLACRRLGPTWSFMSAAWSHAQWLAKRKCSGRDDSSVLSSCEKLAPPITNWKPLTDLVTACATQPASEPQLSRWQLAVDSRHAAPRNPDARTRKNGARYGNRIRRTYPEAFLRMRSILGYYDMPHANRGEKQAVEQVTISMLQTQQYLASEPELRRRLLNYRVLAYNRELEGLHSQTCSYLNSLVKPTASAVPSLLRNRMAANK